MLTGGKMRIYAASYLLPIASPPLAGGALAVNNGRIVAVGTLADLRRAWPGEVSEFPGCVIIPGLVNAHTHLELTHFPLWKIRKDLDYAPRTYVDWVVQVIKIRRALSRQELELSVREGVRISLASGTTAIGEILTDSSLLPLYDTFPLSGRLFFEAIGQESLSCAALQGKLEQLLSSYHGANFVPGLSPHAPHTLSPAFFRDIVQLARAGSLPHAVHLSESTEEAAFMHDSTGGIAKLLYPLAHWEGYLPRPMRTTSTAYLDSLGVLDSRTIAIHCVHITPADADILKQRQVRVVICPRSNDKLAVGQPPLHLFKKTGIPLALGTDSLASNESLSLWDEMRFLLDQDGSPFSPVELLRMASLGAAEILGIQKSAGSLEPGKRGDFLVVDPGAMPSAAGICQSLLERSALQEVYVAGQPVLNKYV